MPIETQGSNDVAADIIDAAIAAHGGMDKLSAASAWVAEIRRYQRGDSYVMTNYYRPGMVRLEQDLGDGQESADVIGDPHCWGRHGPVSIPCSAETRENDRPRVIMEMAAQLWPLKGENWELLQASKVNQGGHEVDIVSARYLPRDTLAKFTFDSTNHMLQSISVQGVKEGVLGTHLHTYSDYRPFCGVQMPAHNVKSFDGRVWVTEDVLELRCEPVNESLFVRPQQVAEGTFLEQTSGPVTLACREFDSALSSLSNAQASLLEPIAQAQLEVSGPSLRLIGSNRSTQLCAQVDTDLKTVNEAIAIEHFPETDLLSIFSLYAFDANTSTLVAQLLAEARKRGFNQTGPVRLYQYDNDGMGLTGEVVIELQLPVARNGES